MRGHVEKGFTLIEVLVALIIISVSLLALAGLLISAIQTNQGSEQRMNAAMVSQAILSDCKARIVQNVTDDCTAIASPYAGFTIVSLNVDPYTSSPRVISVALRPAAGNRMAADFTNITVVE